MVLQNSMSQQAQQPRWAQKNKQPPQSYQTKQPNKQQKNIQTKKTQSSSSLTTLPQSSSSIELPETFGLPSNKTSKQSSSISISKHTSSSTSLNDQSTKQTNEILIDDSIKSPQQQKQQNDDIEIINEISSNSNQQTNDSNQIDLKSYLSKNYSKFNLNISQVNKFQSNFSSNLDLINQLLNKSDYYNNKLKRCKPYSSLKPNAILTVDEDFSDEETSEEKLKNRKIILIDDSNEEMHKPWITPELIKLIKQRNLLQSKLNDRNTGAAEADEELLKKFKNLRNKVTKLVKKARKDYLAKYIQESKSEAKIEKPSEPVKTVSSETVNQTVQESSSKTETQVSTATQNTAVNEITNKLTASGSFLKENSGLMMSLYTKYYNQYIEQYTKQQQQAQALAAEEKKESNEAYDLLQKQAAYYAQQQLAIQNQLESSLVSAAQQLIQEIAEMAAVKTSQPFVLNQYTQQHHMHQHHHHIAPVGAAMAQPILPAGPALLAQAQMMPLVPPPPPGPIPVASKMYY